MMLCAGALFRRRAPGMLAGVPAIVQGTRFVRIGQTVGDWMLTRANAAGARFERQGQQRTVSWPTPAADPSQPSQHPAQGQRPNRARP